MFWWLWIGIGLAAGVALVWGTGLVLCHRAGQVQVILWEKPCSDETGMSPKEHPRSAQSEEE